MEVEVKFRVNFEDMKARLESMGARLVRTEEQEDLYFSVSSPTLLRIRRITNLKRSFLTYKYIRDPGRNEEFDEIGVEVSSFEKIWEILRRLGFKELVWVKKHRLVYELDGVTFELNRVYSVGDFLDIEVISEDPENAKRKIWEMAKKLGLSENDVEPRLYTELIAKIMEIT